MKIFPKKTLRKLTIDGYSGKIKCYNEFWV